MKRKQKKNNKTPVLIYTALSLFLLLLLIGIGKILIDGNNQKIDSRIKQLSKFKKENSKIDAVAWVKVPGTNIDYPVISNEDTVKYQDGDIQYLWKVGDLNKLNRMNLILGHNVMNLSSNPLITEKTHVRFEQLMSFNYLDFAKKNEYVQFTIDGKDYLFKIFAVSYLDKNSYSTYNSSTYNDESVETAIKLAKKYTIFDYDIDVNEKDTLISLITCTNMFDYYDYGSFKVDARLVRENESTKRYKVSTNKNYKKVEKQMKGVEKDEKKI